MSENPWAGWRVVIAPTSAGTYGIYWMDAPAMERRGGYSGPYTTREEAEQGARDWLDYWDVTDFVLQHEDERPEEWGQ